MIHWTRLLGLVSLFVSITSAVLLEDAFVKDWVKYYYSQLHDYELVSGDHLIGFSGKDQLVKINITKGNSLEWMVNLNEMPTLVDHYYLYKKNQLVYLYSNESRVVYLYETRNGVLQTTIELKSSPIKFQNFFNKGVLILGSNGDLSYLDDQGEASGLRTVCKEVKDFRLDQLNGIGYLIVNDDSLVEINSKLEIVSTSKLSVSRIRQFKDSIIITEDNKVLKLSFEGEEGPYFIPIKHSIKTRNLQVINSDYLFDYEGTSIKLYKISDNMINLINIQNVENYIVNVQLISYSLNEILVVSTKTVEDSDLTSSDGNKIVFELTDFLSTDDPSSIKIIKYGNTAYSQDFVGYDDGELKLYSILHGSKMFNVIKICLVTGLSEEFGYDLLYPNASKYLIIDKPKSQISINKVHNLLDDSSYHTFTSRWILRTKRHLSELGKYAVSFFIESENLVNDILDDDEFGFEKLILFYDEQQKSVIAVNSKDGSIFWRTEILHTEAGEFVDLFEINDEIFTVFSKYLYRINPRNGAFNNVPDIFERNVSKAIKVKGQDTKDAFMIKFESDNFVSFGPYQVNPDQYVLEQLYNEVQGYKFKGISTIKTWRFSKENEKILAISSRPQDSTTSSIGITLFDKSILYKYLYPNSISILTKDKEALKFYLVDGITGNLLYSFSHSSDEVIDLSSINLIMDDNWIVYTYFTKSPRLEQRINVIDLFDSSKSIKKDTISVFNYNSTINYISLKSFIFPERIISIASTQTEFGITLKSILAVTRSGALVEIPKYILNSRRIDDKELTQQDFQNDFRMIPYEPVIFKNTFQILNHKHKLLVTEGGMILVKPTNLESTSIGCYINKYNSFCSFIQPSLSYDLLNGKFNKFKLVLTIAALLIGYLILNPFVDNKKLRLNWIDR